MWHLTWGSSHALSPALLVGKFCLASAGCKDQQLLCRGEKGLTQFRVVGSSPARGLVVKVTVLEMGEWGGTVAVLAQGCRRVWGQDRKTI